MTRLALASASVAGLLEKLARPLGLEYARIEATFASGTPTRLLVERREFHEVAGVAAVLVELAALLQVTDGTVAASFHQGSPCPHIVIEIRVPNARRPDDQGGQTRTAGSTPTRDGRARRTP